MTINKQDADSLETLPTSGAQQTSLHAPVLEDRVILRCVLSRIRMFCNVVVLIRRINSQTTATATCNDYVSADTRQSRQRCSN